ncbi:MAG: efflux RND transporter periplasmic adaptor subunit [Planctomycetota bacterium]|jgi:RND family efflux transporter MFP subunit
MNNKKKAILQFLLVLVIFVVALGIAKIMTSLRKSPEKKPQIISVPLLNAISVVPDSIRMIVQGFGTVQARMQVQVVPQVSGKVMKCHPQLVNGGFFMANEPLVVVEQADYELAVESASASVAQAEVQLEKEKAEADVAKKEWEKMKPDQQPDSVLVFRGPQIRNAEAQLNAAKAQLAKAKLDLERTTIRMPFDGRVVFTNVDVGQFITTGSPIATVYRTDQVEIVVPLEDSELAWFDVPQNNNSGAGANADVYSNFAGAEHHWHGQLVRTEGQIDPKSRMVHVVVQVADPFKTESGRPPLVPGMFVRVDIEGRQIRDIYRLPRYAIRQGAEVWVARGTDETKELAVLPVEIIRMDRDFAYIDSGLDEGDFVITSALETVTNGMTIRVIVSDEAKKQ